MAYTVSLTLSLPADTYIYWVAVSFSVIFRSLIEMTKTNKVILVKMSKNIGQ